MKTFRHLRWNFAMFFMDYALFGVASSLIGVGSIMPLFVAKLTGNDELSGLPAAIYPFSWLLPQLFLAQIINRFAHRKPWMLLAIPLRTFFLIVAYIIASAASSHNTILITFLICYVGFAAGDGLLTVVWADMIGSSIPEKMRGILFGSAQFFVTISTLGTREIVQRVLGPSGPEFPFNYGQLFAISSVMYLGAGVCLALLREEDHGPQSQTRLSLQEFLPYLGKVLRTDREFQKFTITRALLDLSYVAQPFYVLFGVQRAFPTPGPARDAFSAQFGGDAILLLTFGTAAGALMTAFLNSRSGSRDVIRLMGVATCLHPICGILSLFVGLPALYMSLFMIGLSMSTTTAGFFDWVITYAPVEYRTIYIGLANTLSAVSRLSPLLGGVLLTIGGNNYLIVFVASLVLGFGGLIGSWFLVEPRRHAERAVQAS